MTFRLVIWIVVGTWALVAAIVVGYPLHTGKIRVGLDTVNRDTAPNSFWTAYIVSTTLFIAVSFVIALFAKAALPPLGR